MPSRKQFATNGDVAAVMNIFTVTPVNTTVTKEELVERVGKPIRVVRDAIAQLVIRGVPIIADRDNGGYRMSNEPLYIMPEIRRLASHARQIRLRYEGLADYLTRTGLAPTTHSDQITDDAWWTERLAPE